MTTVREPRPWNPRQRTRTEQAARLTNPKVLHRFYIMRAAEARRLAAESAADPP